MPKEIIIIGDKVLIEPDEGEGITEAGLYLPQTVKEKDKIQAGKVVKTGPGYPIPNPQTFEREPWMKGNADTYFPLQAQRGDYCMFLKGEAVEIKFENKKYFVVPHSAILLLIRESLPDISETI